MNLDLKQDGLATFDGTAEATETPAAKAAPQGVRIDVNELSRQVRVRNRGELTLLDAVSFTLSAGELVAIVGPSGAGKTTLLEAIAGITPATSGSVRFDGTDVYANLGAFRSVLGYVPQDDIIHADLPLQRTLRYAARLRLPSSTTAAEVDDAVHDAIDAVGLTDQAEVRVGSLSGGQRKRASIAVELLTDPHVFFLDEPTSGLDPVTSAELIARLRQLADRSATVVFTSHSVEDLAVCDRIVFLTRRGRVGFVGTVDEALDQFGVSTVTELYRHLADLDGTTYSPGTAARVPTPDAGPRDVVSRPAASGLTQWGVLTRRTLETFVRNRLTLAILVGSPALVIGMFATLFRPGAFDFHDPSPSSMVMIGFWVVFAAFFFGLTYGLLQICTERTILRRERHVGLRLGAYVASKVTVLVPFLLLVIVAMLGVLRLLDRLPNRPLPTYTSITVSLLLCAVAALGLGLLTSAMVGNVREYQTMGLLPPPRKRGRVGIYGASHLNWLRLIARLQDRGYSLAGIRDLLAAWRDGFELGEVLGLGPDQLVHIDEPGVPATIDQLACLLPDLVPGRLDDLLATGAVEACGPDRYCVPSPSLLQLTTTDALASGYDPDRVLDLLGVIGRATDTVADVAVAVLAERPAGVDADRLLAFATRGRGLLAHGTGRLTIHRLGRRLGITNEATAPETLRRLLEDRP